jgi:hypothetical protein
MKWGNKMIELSITRTSKNFGSSDDYTIFDTEQKRFTSIAGAKLWLQNEYGNCKRQKLYYDKRDGKTRHNGYVYCFKNKDWSHDSKSWLQQDWVSFSKITTLSI